MTMKVFHGRPYNILAFACVLFSFSRHASLAFCPRHPQPPRSQRILVSIDHNENDGQHDNKDSTIVNKISESSSSIGDGKLSGCPFERAFPRYKIDLSAPPRPNQRSTSNKNSINNLWSSVVSQGTQKMENMFLKGPSSLVRKMQLQAQEQRLASQFPTSRILVLSSSYAGEGDTDKENHNKFRGAHAMTLLWQTVADLLLEHVTGTCAASITITTIIYLENDDDGRLLQNFGDILQWGLHHVPDLQPVASTVLSTVEYLPNDKVLRLDWLPKQNNNTDDQSLDYSSLRLFASKDSNDFERQQNYCNEIAQHTQAWVKRVLVKMGICPFTKSVQKSGQGLADVGVPVARIVYPTSTSRNAIVLLADTWRAILEFLQAGPQEQSSILLAAPAYDDDFATWAGPIFCILETSVVAAQAEADVGVVCFHPAYATPDGSTWPGFGHMHSVPRLTQWVVQQQKEQELLKQKQNRYSMTSDQASATPPSADPSICLLSREEIAAGGAWQRRTPHATINVLRADQLARAEGRRDSASLYPRNIRALLAVGNEQLQAALDQERNLASSASKSSQSPSFS